MVEGTSLLRKHMGLNLYRGFESLRLRQRIQALDENQGLFSFFTPNRFILLEAEQLTIKRSKRWNGEIDTLTPDYLNQVMGQMNAYGDRVQFSLVRGPQPNYQVINTFEKKMAFDANHHLLHPSEEDFSETNVTKIFSMDQVRAWIANAGVRKQAAERPRVRSVRSSSSAARPVTAAQKLEESLDALKYAYFKEHSASLPEGIKAHSQEITQLMKKGMTAEAAFAQVVDQYF